MIEIAEELGVSKSTVSRAFDPSSNISNEVRSRILEYAKEKNYVLNRAASRLSMREINIGMLYPKVYSYATNEFIRGINDGSLELFDLKVNVDFYPYDRSEMDGKKLSVFLSGLKSYDGLIINGFTERDEIAALNRYSEDGIKLVVLQNDVPGLNRLFASCHDSALSSAMAAEFIGNCLFRSESKDVLLFTGDRNSELHRTAEKSFLEAAEQNRLNVTDSVDMKDSPELLSKQLVQLFENERKKPDAIYITSGESLPLCRYISENGLSDSTVLVTFDVYPELAEFIASGTVNATFYQNHYKQGKNAFTNLVKYLIGQCGVDGFVSPVPELVMKSNLRFYLN